MSYLDFSIRKEHTFLRNIFSKQGTKSKKLKILKTYYDNFKLLKKKLVLLESSTNKYSTFDEIIDNNLIDFFFQIIVMNFLILMKFKKK